MLDIVSQRLNQILIAATLDRDNQPEERFDPYYSRNSNFNTITGLMASRLSADSVLTAQGANNGEDAIATLADAKEGFASIESLLDEMADIAETSADDDLSDVQRQILDLEFRTLRAEINQIAADVEAGNVFLLADIASFSATSIGNKIEPNDGFAAFTFANPTNGAVADGDVIEIDYSSSTNQFTVTNQTTGERVISDAVTTPSAGQTVDVAIRNLGFTITLDETFNDAADITDQNTFTLSGSISARTFDVQVGKDGQAEDQVPLDLEASFVSALASGLRTADIQSASSAVTAEADVATAQATLADIQSKVLGARERLAHASAVNFRSAGALKSSADATLFEQDDRLRYNAEIAEQFQAYIRVQVGQDVLQGREQKFTFNFTI